MDLDAETVEKLRRNPRSADSYNTLERAMEIVCGEKFKFYVDKDWPDTEFSTITGPWHSSNIHRLFPLSTLGASLVAGNWYDAARWMFFFRIKFFQFAEFTWDDGLKEFIKVFPFGCFGSECEKHVVNYNPANCWCLGKICSGLLYDFQIYDDNAFKLLCDTTNKTVFFLGSFNTVTAALNLNYVETMKETHPVKRALAESRLAAYTKIMSQQFILPDKYGLSPFYPCITENFYWVRHLPHIKYSKPVWSRQNHLKLVHAKFNNALVKTVIMMQRFRHQNFPLHRDLIDVVIRHVFSFHVDDLNQTMKRQKARVHELESDPEKARYAGFQVGISSEHQYFDISNELKLGDIFNLENGIPVGLVRQTTYDDYVIELILEIGKIRYEDPEVADLPIKSTRLAKIIAKHLLTIKDGLISYLNGVLVLTSEDMAILRGRDHYLF